jgi:hypothetical protein
MWNRSKFVVLIAIVVVLILGVCWLRFGLRVTPRKPVAAIRGTSLYLDDAVCADCHADQAAGLKKTGHANTFRLARDSSAARWLHGRTFQDPERGYEYHYRFVEGEGLSVTIPQKFGEDRFALPYELGSGKNAVTFLTLIPSRLGETVGIEHRVSLYGPKSNWEMDLTPGHQESIPRQDVEHFGLVIQGDKLTRCVSCHTTSGEIVRQEIVNLRPHVGCQSCHGPGREHLIAVESGGTGDYSGFSQRSATAEIHLCGRCHRLPNAEPDMPVDPDNRKLVRFQSVGLLQSACFQLAGQSLKCSTCHDPHQPVVRDAGHYVQRCLSCHGQPGSSSKSCPVSPGTRCIQCHMPPVDVHRGITFHDHWIRVHPLGQDADVAKDVGVAKDSEDESPRGSRP